MQQIPGRYLIMNTPRRGVSRRFRSCSANRKERDFNMASSHDAAGNSKLNFKEFNLDSSEITSCIHSDIRLFMVSCILYELKSEPFLLNLAYLICLAC